MTTSVTVEVGIGVATWNTPLHPLIASSKEPSSNKSALNNLSLSLAPSNEVRGLVLDSSPDNAIKKQNVFMPLRWVIYNERPKTR